MVCVVSVFHLSDESVTNTQAVPTAAVCCKLVACVISYKRHMSIDHRELEESVTRPDAVGTVGLIYWKIHMKRLIPLSGRCRHRGYLRLA